MNQSYPHLVRPKRSTALLLAELYQECAYTSRRRRCLRGATHIGVRAWVIARWQPLDCWRVELGAISNQIGLYAPVIGRPPAAELGNLYEFRSSTDSAKRRIFNSSDRDDVFGYPVTLKCIIAPIVLEIRRATRVNRGIQDGFPVDTRPPGHSIRIQVPCSFVTRGHEECNVGIPSGQVIHSSRNGRIFPKH